jgi:hypothetical protein
LFVCTSHHFEKQALMNIGMGGEGGGGKKGHKARTPSLTLLEIFSYGYLQMCWKFSLELNVH